MYRLCADDHVGRKNIVFGSALFLIAGVLVGIPLTINLFGGSVLPTSLNRLRSRRSGPERVDHQGEHGHVEASGWSSGTSPETSSSG